MPRPNNFRKVQVPPRAKGFVPMGYYGSQLSPVQLFIEEYESIRLLDYENLSQEEAATMMEISRPTLTRIYERARRKIAIALTESHPIIIDGGKVVYMGNWFECIRCLSKFNNPENKDISTCPLCEADEIKQLENVTV